MRLKENQRLTPEEVRKLPAGSVVQLHSLDRRGLHQWIDLTVVKSGPRKKILVARNAWSGEKIEKEIKAYPKAYYVLVRKA